MQLPEIPKGPTGKPRRLDMQHLLAQELVSVYLPPRTPTEYLLVALYEETLGRAPVGRNEDFFLGGGDSLSGTGLVAQLNTIFTLALSPEILFRHATPAELAAHLDTLDGGRVARLIQTMAEHEDSA